MLRSIVPLACLVLAAPLPSARAAPLVGCWELTGIGAPHNLTRPDRAGLSFTAEGVVEVSVWESEAIAPDRSQGRYAVAGDLLTVDWPDHSVHETYRISWEGPVLALKPVDAGGRDGPALYLERRAWM